MARHPARGGQRRQRGALHGAGAPLGDRQHACAPVALLRVLRPGARHDHARAGREVAAELRRPRGHRLPVGNAARQKLVHEVRHRRLAGTLRRLRAIHLEADQVGHHPQQRGRRLGAAHAVAKLADRRLGDRQLDGPGISFERHHRSLVVRRRAGDRQHAAPRSSTITLASSARPAARATLGRPAPASTASETASSASRNERGSAVSPPAALAGSCETDILPIVPPTWPGASGSTQLGRVRTDAV